MISEVPIMEVTVYEPSKDKHRGEVIEGINAPVSEEMKKRKKELRKHMTEQEKNLWYRFFLLFNDQGPEFIHQKVIGHYIVDFFCFELDLIIEIDGGQHFTEAGRAYDAARTKKLQYWGFEVVRYSNKEVNENFPGVCQDIINRIEEKAVKVFQN